MAAAALFNTLCATLERENSRAGGERKGAAAGCLRDRERDCRREFFFFFFLVFVEKSGEIFLLVSSGE